MQELDNCISRLTGTNQDHLLALLGHGSDADKSSLIQQLTKDLPGVDFHHLNDVLRDSIRLSKTDSTAVIEPPPKDFLLDVPAELRSKPGHIAELETLGYEAIHLGHVAFLILAGGSGTRLGADAPKGFFTCDGLQQKKSLFQIHCEKIRRREDVAAARFGGKPSARIQLLVMTSAQNDTQTQKYFAENKFFGLSPDQVHFFKQLSLPCYEEETGKILMESSGRMCLAPGGNGGVYMALTTPPHDKKESVLQRMERMGIRYVQIGNVDNMLAKVADPIFIGLAVKEHVDVVVKSSPKTCPEESVGVFVRADGEWGVVEYTEVGERAKEVDSATGELRFNCANISCNVCSVPFLRVAAEHMKSFTRYHIARKKIPTINGPTMGVKLEAFIFDLFQFAKECGNDSAQGGGFRIMQVDRSEDFAPIKNAEGATSDTPTEAARLTLALHKRWLTAALQAIAAAGGADAKDATAALAVLQRDSVSVEVSPLVSSGGEGLAPYLPRVIQQLLCGDGEKILVEREDEHVMDRSNI